MAALLTIQIVGYNGAKYLAQAAAALARIPPGEALFRYIDNGSTDDSVRIVRQVLPQADVITRGVNTGYAAGHNLGFSLCTTPFVLVHDQDVILNWTGILKLLAAFDDPEVAAVQGKLYRLQEEPKKKEIFDTAGIVQTLTLNGVDRGANEEDRGQFEKPARLLATQGACSLYRLDALLEVAYTRASSPHPELADSLDDQEVPDIFDEDFFAYKEEVDLGWRLTSAHWKVVFRPEVMGHHARTLGKRGVGGWGLSPAGIFNRLKSPRTRLSLRNYCWMIAKNASVGQLILHSPAVAGRLLIFFVFTLLYPPLFPVWGETIRGLPRMLAKRL